MSMQNVIFLERFSDIITSNDIDVIKMDRLLELQSDIEEAAGLAAMFEDDDDDCASGACKL